MRKVLFLFQIAIAIGAYAQQSGADLIIRLQGVKPDGKKLMIGVGDYKNNPQDMYAKMVTADSAIVTCRIKDIPKGNHFIYIYHDSNENQKLDFSQSGKPAEGVAMDKKYSWEPAVQVNDTVKQINLSMYYFN